MKSKVKKTQKSQTSKIDINQIIQNTSISFEQSPEKPLNLTNGEAQDNLGCPDSNSQKSMIFIDDGSEVWHTNSCVQI